MKYFTIILCVLCAGIIIEDSVILNILSGKLNLIKITLDKSNSLKIKEFNTIPEGVDSERYFIVSYWSARKEDEVPTINGNTTFSATGFPSKNDIDSIVYASFPEKRKCYRNIIIASIFEFKNKKDYEDYIYNLKSDKIENKKKECNGCIFKKESVHFYPYKIQDYPDSFLKIDTAPIYKYY